MDQERRAAILLNLLASGHPRRRPPPPVEVLLHGDRDALREAGIGASGLDRFLELRRGDAADEEVRRTERLGARILTVADADYPAPLVGHPDAPTVLYVAGAGLPPSPRAALVGARAAASAQLRFARRLGRACGEAGVAVVSGLARGIDAAAHEGCLDGDGRPIGVLGTGIDRTYPRETRRLHGRVRERGLLVTPYPLGTSPNAPNFPARNRIVAALADSVTVVAATEDSGSMSTARAALDAGTEVSAVPGSPDDPLSRGTNRLLRDGARPILEPADLLDPLVGLGVVRAEAFRRDRRAGASAAAEESDPLLREIAALPRTPDELAEILDRPVGEVVSRLIELELRGRAERLPGRRFRRVE
ncbi:MAG: DNA-processing protein DprA [Planctomycetota bacterium JB042]